MENIVETYTSKEFGKIRTVTKDNEPMFCLVDVCKALELEQVSRVKSRLKEDGVTNSKVIDRLGREQEATFINESNLYKVIFQSRKPSAERFTDWVTDEVIPSIRKNGGYIANQEKMTPEQIVANALIVAQNIISQKDRQIEELETSVQQMDLVITEMTPKVDYADRILSSTDCMTVSQIAQDYGMSAKRFNKILHAAGIQRKVGNQWILYAEYQGKGYVRNKTCEYAKGNGEMGTKLLTVWTQKGRMLIYEELKRIGVFPQMENAS